MRPAARVSFIALALLLAAAAAPARDDEPTTLVYPPFGHCLGLHRATSFHLFVYLGTRTRFNEPAGIAAVKLDALDDPSTSSDDDELTVFGLNSGNSEIIYNTSLTTVEIFGEPGGGEGQFRDPLGIAADSRGNVFVADTGNDRVVRLLYGDDGLRFVKHFYVPDSPLKRPSDVSMGASGKLYVADTGNDRVVSLTSTGSFVSSFAGDDSAGLSLDSPTGISVVEADDPWISRRQDFVVVVDSGGRRISKFTTDGRIVASLNSADVPVAEASFGGVAIDYYGNVYATDRSGGRIHKFDRRMRYVTSVGSPGTGDMEMDEPRGITLWKRFGQIFITERAGAQYFWIGSDILDVEAEPDRIVAGEQGLRLRYFLTETSRVNVELLDERGRKVCAIVSNRRRAVGENVESWDGTTGPRGRPVPPGSYTLSITATPTYSSGEYFHDTAEVKIAVAAPEEP